jgi:hypothetical protein
VLVVTYAATSQRPIQVDASWRVLTSLPSSGWTAAIELAVSVRTQMLDSRAELAVQSMLAIRESLRLANPAAPRFEPAEVSQNHATLVWESGPGCVLFRLPDAGQSYVEMVHPVDFQHDELASAAGEGPHVRASHRLFQESLEKGVLLRSRVRGIFLPRTNDLAVAAQAYAEFAAEEPPLGTY